MTNSIPIPDDLYSLMSYLHSHNPAVRKVYSAENESEFIEGAEEAIKNAIVQIESGARLLSSHGEEELSWHLTEYLFAAGIPATKERFHNGHVDITISHPHQRSFTILGECKIWKGYERHCDGCQQLLERYSSGRQKRGFCLEFFKVKEMYKKLKDLRKSFDKDKPLRQIEESEDHNIKGAFLSKHRHFTESVVEVLHLGCNAYHPDGKP